MMRAQFDAQLTLLNNELTEMGTYCENGIDMVIQVLSGGVNIYIKDMEKLNQEARQLRREIENQCIKLFLQQQPVARDLRQISAALKMVTDLERISEQSLDIGNVIRYASADKLPEYDAINNMAGAAINMVKESIKAYVTRDLKLAYKVIESDDEVDDAFDFIKKDLIRIIAVTPDNGEPALDMLMIAKYLEGIGDHAVNVAQWVIFALTGTLPEDDSDAEQDSNE